MKTFKTLSTLALLICMLYEQSHAFVMGPSISRHFQRTSSTASSLNSHFDDRRAFMNKLLVPATLAGASFVGLPTRPAEATIMDNNMKEIKTFQSGEMSAEDAKTRFKLAVQDVDELLSNYAEIAAGGGDNVRRYLGTVGVKSHMYGITKVLKELREEADDVIEFTETSNEFEAYLFQAEGAAYQSLFAEHSSAKSTPETLLATAKKDVINMRKLMGDLATQLHIDV